MKLTLKTRWILIIIIALIVSLISITIDAQNFSSTRYRVNNQTISSTKIPKSHEGMTIACFGDLEFGKFMNLDRLEMIVNKINRMSPDVILFLGDLYDRNYEVSEETEIEIITLLNRLNAPEGKFAICGDYDEDYDKVAYALMNAGFEMAENKVFQLHHGTNEYINLVGLSTNISNEFNIMDIYSNVDATTYTMAFAHSPNIVDALPVNSTELLVAANAHGSQISLPIFGSSQNKNNYQPGKHVVNSTTLFASRGIGTTKKDIRLFSDPEIILFKLHSSK